VATVPLTSLARGGGCGCKIGPADLLPIVRRLPPQEHPNVLVGAAATDDAGVYRITDGIALVQTVDFFTPIVDDPYDFGRIAAANALSDVYAMGGRPVTALNLVAFPLERLGPDVLGEILQGGFDVCAQAGATVLGGHSISDPEPKFGLAVTGVVAPGKLLTNGGGRPGDVLTLSKPLGVGAITTAVKRGVGGPELLAAAVEAMTELNAAAAEAARAAGARALTDITGFGLLGHLHSLAHASGAAAKVDAAALHALPYAEELLADESAVSGGSRRNREYAEGFTSWDASVPEWRRRLACDATTSGGLLAAVPAECAAETTAPIVGHLVAGRAGAIFVS